MLISDGNDTDSQVSLSEVKQLIRESEVMVYADRHRRAGRRCVRLPADDARAGAAADPIPFPGSRRPRGPGGVILPQLLQFQWPFPQRQGRRTVRTGDDRVNVQALREITDDSGGRTEIVRSGRDLDPATANIADELSQQYLSRLRVDDEEGWPLARDSR